MERWQRNNGKLATECGLLKGEKMGKTGMEKDIMSKCSVCGRAILVDSFGQGDCKHCGWMQNNCAIKSPDEVEYPNLITLNRAKELFKSGKPVKANFKEFVFAYCNISGEFEFRYKGRRFGLMCPHGIIEFYEWNILEGFQEYETKEEFAQKANIDGKLLKDIWDDVTEAGLMQE